MSKRYDESDVDGLEFTVEKKKAKGTKFKELNEDTIFDAVMVEIKKEQAPFGEVLRWIFELLDEEYNYTVENEDGGEKEVRRRKVSGTTSLLCKPNTKLYKWYSKILGEEPAVGEKIDLKNIIDVECRLLVKNTKSKKADDDGNFRVYSNVDRILTAEDGPKTGKFTEPKKKATKKTTKEEKPEKKATKKTKTTKKEPEDDGGEDMFGDIF